MRQQACDLKAQIEAGDYALPAWVGIVRVYHKLARRLERMLDEHGLALPHFEILVKLTMGEGITQQELASRLLVTKGNICILVDRLESHGWVERRAHPEDRRANRLFLTAKGKKLLDGAFPRHLEIVREAMGSLTGPQLKGLHEALNRVDRAMEVD